MPETDVPSESSPLGQLTIQALNAAFDLEVVGVKPPPPGYVRIKPIPNYCGDLNILQPFIEACRRCKFTWTGIEWWVDLDAPTYGDAVDKVMGRAFVIARILAKRAEILEAPRPSSDTGRTSES